MADTLKARLDKLKELSMMRNQARKLNHEEVAEENRRDNQPTNADARQKKAEYILQEEKAKQEAAAEGKDYTRQKWLETGADDAEMHHWARKRKQNPDPGFSDFEQATARQYTRLTGQLKVDQEAYQKEKERLGPEAFYPTANTLIIGQHKDSKEAIDRMCSDLARTQAKRAKFSRRRGQDPEGPVDYINERNRKFNEKVERFFGPYTKEIKDDLERGTAV